MNNSQYKLIKTLVTHPDWAFHIVFCNSRKRKLFMKELKNSNISSLKKMYYERDITSTNDNSWIIQPIAIEEYKTSHCMLYEYSNAMPLSELSKEKLTLSQFKKISISIVNSFIGFGQQQQLYQSLDAHYVLINPNNYNISYITYDGFSSFYNENLNRSKKLVRNTTMVHYFSPEQTGQTNQQIDFRSDLYSVGVLFYFLLTNQYPFEENNSNNLIYDILTKKAPLLKKARPDLPVMLSEIIDKLLQKDKSLRYQSAVGLKNDLEILFKNISFNAYHDKFQLGLNDARLTSNLSKQFIGRKTEMKIFEKALLKTTQGKNQIFTIDGHSGVGKSTYIREIFYNTLATHGLFITTKIEKAKFALEYSLIVNSIRQLLKEVILNSSDLSKWKLRIKNAKLTKSSILLENIPEINWFLDDSNIKSESTFISKKMINIFYADLSKIFKIFSDEKKPIVLFFDDIQWASTKAVSDLVDFFLKYELNYFCVVLSYRTEEFKNNESIIKSLSASSSFSSIHLEPLSQCEILDWLNNSITMSENDYAKTVNQLYYFAKGNPLHTYNLFSSMLRNNILFYSNEKKIWVFDETKIGSLQLSNDIQELLATKMKTLPIEYLQVLNVASYFGNTFNLNELLYVTKIHFHQLNLILKRLIYDGYISPTNTSYEYANILNELNLLQSEDISFQFVHDHIQHISENLFPKNEKKILNYQIGLYYYKINNSDSLDNLEKLTFNWNQCIELLTETEKSLLINWNHLLSNKALNAGLFTISFQHIEKCFELFQEDHWETAYSTTFAIYISRAYVEGLLFEVHDAILLLDEALNHVVTLEDKLKIYFVKTRIYLDRDEAWKSTHIGVQALKLASFNIPLDPKPSQIALEYFRTNIALTSKNIERSNQPPKKVDPVIETVITIMIDLISTGFLVNKNLAVFLILRCVRIILDYGKTNVNTIIWNNYASILIVGFNKYKKGSIYYEKSINEVEKMSDIKSLANIYLTNGTFITHWKNSFELNIEHLRKAQKYAIELNLNHMIAGSSSLIVAIHFVAGSSLKVIKNEIIHQQSIVQPTPMSLSTNYFNEINYWIECLETDKKEIDWKQKNIFINDDMIVFMHYSIRQFMAYLLKEKAFLKEIMLEIIDLESRVSILPIVPHTLFIQSIAIFDFIYYDDFSVHHSSKSLRKSLKSKLKKNVKQLKEWSLLQPNNFQHMYCLIEAELARAQGNSKLVLHHFDRAIQTSRQYNHLQDEAICCERAALYCLSIKDKFSSKNYLTQAFLALEKWGARNIISKWTSTYGSLIDLSNTSNFSLKNSSELPLMSDITDVFTHAYSVDHLLKSTGSLLLRNIGATKCTWYNYSFGEIDFVATMNRNSTFICKDQSLSVFGNPLVENLLNLVENSKEILHLNAADNYNVYQLSDHTSLSHFYLPIFQNEEISAILSFENDHISNAFSNTDIESVKMITTQVVQLINQLTIVSNLEAIVQNRTDSLLEVNKELLETNQNIEYSKNNLQNSFKLISHDLRSPLTSVIGFIDLLIDRIIIDPQLIEEYLIRSREKLFTMNQMIQDLFDLSKLETGSLQMNFETWSAHNLYFDLNSQLSFDVNQTHLDYLSEMELEGELLISIDLQRIEQVLMNLVQNAVKHTKTGSISFSMVKNNDYIDFMISDTGSGIDPKHLPFIFDINYSKSKSSSTDSSGIGLAVCKQIIENHNGQFKVDCILGKGSTFTFSIPYLIP